jgi:carbonic anhydrase
LPDDADFPAGVGADNDVTDRLSKRNVLRQLSALRTYDSVAEREQAGNLRLHGWWLDIRAPRVEVWSAEQQRFVPFEAYFDGASS